MGLRRPWSDLPTDILNRLIDLLTFSDHVRFGAVCRSWSSATKTTRHFRSLQFPWLLFRLDPTSPTLGLLSPMEGKLHLVEPPFSDDFRLLESNTAWLMVARENCHSCRHLFHPFTGRKIHLPRAVYTYHGKPTEDWEAAWRSRAPSRAIFLSPPSFSEPHNDVDVVICGHDKFQVFHSGGGIPAELRMQTGEDMILLKGRLYHLTLDHKVHVYELAPALRCIETYSAAAAAPVGDSPKYLVECRGELMMVARRLDKKFMTSRFDVFRLDRSVPEWLHVESLGNEVVFLDRGASRSFTASDASGFLRNCVYFTGFFRNWTECRRGDQGVFCLEDGEIHPLPHSQFQVTKSPAIWFTPNI